MNYWCLFFNLAKLTQWCLEIKQCFKIVDFLGSILSTTFGCGPISSFFTIFFVTPKLMQECATLPYHVTRIARDRGVKETIPHWPRLNLGLNKI